MEVIGRRVACKCAANNTNNKGRSRKETNEIPQPSNDSKRLDKTIKDGQETRFDRPKNNPEHLDDGELPLGQLVPLLHHFLRVECYATGLKVCHVPQSMHLLRL